MECKNTVLDDICAHIGYTATMVLSAWYGDREVYIPVEFSPEHPLARLLGESALRRLVENYPGDYIFVPKNSLYYRSVRHRDVIELLNHGVPVKRISTILDITPAQIKNIRTELEDIGMLPRILTPKAKC